MYSQKFQEEVTALATESNEELHAISPFAAYMNAQIITLLFDPAWPMPVQAYKIIGRTIRRIGKLLEEDGYKGEGL